MDLRTIIAAEKSDIKINAWHTGKVPRADFPLAKSPLRLGASFEWCVVTFTARNVVFWFSSIRENRSTMPSWES